MWTLQLTYGLWKIGKGDVLDGVIFNDGGEGLVRRVN